MIVEQLLNHCGTIVELSLNYRYSIVQPPLIPLPDAIDISCLLHNKAEQVRPLRARLETKQTILASPPEHQFLNHCRSLIEQSLNYR